MNPNDLRPQASGFRHSFSSPWPEGRGLTPDARPRASNGLLLRTAAAVLTAGFLLLPPPVRAANSYMAEMDIMEFKGDKIGPVPAITLASTDGRTVNLRDLKGRSLLLVFWAST